MTELQELNQKETFTVGELSRWLYLSGRAKSPPHPETLRVKIRLGEIPVSDRKGKGQGGGYVISRQVAEGLEILGRGRPKGEKKASDE